jgi:hypothetical protein
MESKQEFVTDVVEKLNMYKNILYCIELGGELEFDVRDKNIELLMYLLFNIFSTETFKFDYAPDYFVCNDEKFIVQSKKEDIKIIKSKCIKIHGRMQFRHSTEIRFFNFPYSVDERIRMDMQSGWSRNKLEKCKLGWIPKINLFK